MAEVVQRRLLFFSAAAGIFVFGIVMAILGTILGLPETHTRFRMDLGDQGNLISFLYIGIFLATFVAGPLIDTIGNKWILAVSSLLVAAAMFEFSLAQSFLAAALSSFLLGLGGGGLNTSTNALVSELYSENRGRMLNLLGIFYGIGAFSIPLLSAAISGHFTIFQLFLFCTALSVACALLFGFLRFPASVAQSRNFSAHDLFQVIRFPGIFLLAFILFCQSGNEACIAGWTSTYAGTRNIDPRVATLILAGYWASVMIGRLLAAKLLARLSKTQLVLFCGATAVAGSAVLLNAHSIPAFVFAAALIGFSYAPVFPTVLAIAGDAYQKLMGTVFSLLFSIALLGGISFPWSVGRLAVHSGVRTGMLVPLLGAAGIAVLISRYRTRRPESPTHPQPERRT